ncbi:MAG TPA: flavodoxin family protein, partial [Anaerovoracaceae bacterium]|nr:flavodoxin family protein [Anaerovoracaceae bacterium]
MKILILNGSPRLNGNTRTALNEISQSIRSNITGVEVELIDVTKHKLSGCTNCDSCRRNGGKCVLPDDSAKIIQKIYDSEVVILGTPVYYWGISAQLKMVVDKLYSKDDQFRQQKKKLGLVTVG